MKFLLVLSLILVSCSETTTPERKGKRDARVVDLFPTDVSETIDLPSKDRNPDRTAERDISDTNFEDTSARLSNAIAITEISTLLDVVEVATPVGISENALPFLNVSYHLGDPTLRYLHLDVTIENDALVVSRREDSPIVDESVSISGQVVAFDPTRVRVQCSPFRTGTAIVNITVDPVKIEQSFINFWSNIATGSNNKDVAFMSVRFETSSEITLERVSPAGTVNGHVCVTESLGETFLVQHLFSKIPEGETEVLVPIETIDLDRSIVFVSHQATRTEAKPGYSHVSCELQSSAVRCLRGLNEAEISDLRIQIVTFKDRTSVSRFHVVIEDGVKETRLDLPGIESKNSVVFGAVGVLGEVATDGVEKLDVPASHVEAVIENDGIRFKRGEPWTGRLEFFPQVVHW